MNSDFHVSLCGFSLFFLKFFDENCDLFELKNKVRIDLKKFDKI